MARAVHALLAAAAGLALTGCGSATVAELPTPAGPAVSPALTRTPAGRLTATTVADAVPASTPAGRRHLLEVLGANPSPGRALLRDGALEVVVAPRARTLTLRRGGRIVATTPAGVGPTHVVCAPQGPCFVVDTGGDALLVFRVGAGGRSLELTRRVFLAGAPYGIAIDARRRRLWVTLTARNELVELGAHGRPHVLQRLPTVRQPDAVQVDEASGDVLVSGTRPRLQQRLHDPASPDR